VPEGVRCRGPGVRGGGLSRRLRLAQDPMVANPPPANGGLSVDVDQLEGGTPIGAGERPRHLEDAGRTSDRLDSERRRPVWQRLIATSGEGGVEHPHGVAKERALRIGQAPVIGDERRQRHVLHLASSPEAASRSARKLSTSSNTL